VVWHRSFYRLRIRTSRLASSIFSSPSPPDSLSDTPLPASAPCCRLLETTTLCMIPASLSLVPRSLLSMPSRSLFRPPTQDDGRLACPGSLAHVDPSFLPLWLSLRNSLFRFSRLRGPTLPQCRTSDQSITRLFLPFFPPFFPPVVFS